MSQPKPTPDLDQVLVVRADACEYGVPIGSVVEVIRVPRDVTPLPGAPASVQGVINVRGRIVPVIDLGLRLGETATEPGRSARVVVVESRAGDTRSAGLLSGTVRRLARLQPDAVEWLAHDESDGLAPLVARIDGNLVLIVDVPRLLGHSPSLCVPAKMAEVVETEIPAAAEATPIPAVDVPLGPPADTVLAPVDPTVGIAPAPLEPSVQVASVPEGESPMPIPVRADVEVLPLNVYAPDSGLTALEVVRSVSEGMRLFTADDVWDVLTDHPELRVKTLSGVMRQARARDVVRSTTLSEPSRRPKWRGKRVRIWESVALAPVRADIPLGSNIVPLRQAA